jgi:hypothetical protein
MGYLRRTLVSGGGGGEVGSGAPLNGGKSQINLGGIQSYGDYPFINLFKAAANWTCTYSADGVVPDPDILDMDGYPTALTSGAGYGAVMFFARKVDRPGEYKLVWDGGGSFANWTASSITGGSLSSASGTTNNWCTGVPWVDVPSSNFALVITALSAAPNHIRNIRFYHVDDAVDFEVNGEIFGKKLRERLAEAKFGVIRFMDWQNNNTNNATTWASNRRLTHCSYYASEFRGAAWGANKWYFGVTTNSGNNYSISTTRGRAPINGDIIQLRWNVDATPSGTCSLNVDGSGAVNILDSYANALSTGGNSYPKALAYGVAGFYNYATLVYNSAIPAWIKQGGDIAAPASGLNNATPPQLGLLLAQRVGAHPWFTMPMQSMDPMTDYVTQLATYCRDNAPSWMVPRFEPPNECFNNFGGFFNNSNCIRRNIAYGWPSGGPEDYVHVYGKFASTMGQDLQTVYGTGAANRAKYVFLASGQTTSAAGSPTTAANIFTSARYVAQVPAAQAGYIKAPASNYLHGVSVANYYAPSNYRDGGSVSESAMAAAVPQQVAEYIALCYANSPDDGQPGYNIYRNQTDFTAWKNIAVANGVMLMEFYEGGFSPDYDSNTVVNSLKDAAKYHVDLKAVVAAEYAICTGISGGGFTARFPSHYYLSGNKWMHGGVSASVWSLLDDLYETPGTAQWQAIVTYNNT